MAQLRDAQTSALLAEGTPEELVALAAELGERDVVYDGVGDKFDPAAVRKAAKDRADALDRVVRDAPAGATDERVKPTATRDAAKAALVAKADVVAKARERQQTARDRVAEREKG